MTVRGDRDGVTDLLLTVQLVGTTAGEVYAVTGSADATLAVVGEGGGPANSALRSWSAGRPTS